MRVDAPHVLCVGVDTGTETQIRSAFEDRQISAELSTKSGFSAAIDCLQTNAESIDCVISSNALANASAIELLRTVRDSFPDLPYILFVEDLTSDLINDAIDAGVTDYLPQDGGETQVSRLVDRALDVISQVRATAHAAERERINTTVRELTQELVHASTSKEIDERVCEILSESEPYLFAWIGEHNVESQVVTGRAAAGVEEGYLDAITITTDEKLTAQGPTGKAIQTHEMQVMQNIPADPAYEPWREEALERGYRSSAAIPLVHEETLYGVLNVYADRTNAFDAAEQAVLEELSTTIAYAHHDMEIREEARRFHRAVEQAADAIFITDTDGTTEYANPAFEELTGYTADEAVGRNPRILKSGEQPTEYYESMWATILDGEVWESEIINTNRSGEQYYAEQTVAPLQGASGTIEGFVAIQRDITDRKERERELERSKDRLRLLFDNAPDGIVVHDIEGEILDVNETLIENLGYTREELLSMDVFDFEVGIDEELVRNEWESMDPGSIHKAEVEGRHRRKDGSTYPCEVWITRVEGGSQERDRFIALTRDITDRKRREREQQEIQQRLELAVETANAGVWEWDIKAETVSWEDSMERLLGLEPGSFDGTYEAFIERVHPKDRSTVEETIERALEQETGFEQEFRLRHTSGEFIWMLVRARLFTDLETAPERMIGVGIDISERIDQTRQLEVLDRVLRHNLRNDMTTIQGFAETIRADVDGVTDETGVIIETSRKLMKTVEKEREIVELLSDRPDRETFDIVTVCQRVVADIREEYPEALIEINHSGRASVTAIQEVGRAIEELIENALVHNDQETPEVSLDVKACGDTVRIEIADNGPGIPEEEVNVLTREYEIEPLYHGSGLGLWLVNWIVKLSDGTLLFEENEPHGSIITIELDQPM